MGVLGLRGVLAPGRAAGRVKEYSKEHIFGSNHGPAMFLKIKKVFYVDLYTLLHTSLGNTIEAAKDVGSPLSYKRKFQSLKTKS